MSDVNNEQKVEDRSNLPENYDKYKDYYDMNEPVKESGNSDAGEVKEEQPIVDVKPTEEVVTEPTSTVKEEATRPEKRGLSTEAQGTIDKLVRKNKQAKEKLKAMEEELAALKGEKDSKIDVNNATNAEYIEDTIRRRMAEEREKMLTEQHKSLLDEHNRVQEEAFATTWTERVRSNFKTPEQQQQFVQLVSQSKVDLDDGVQEYIDNSELGPTILAALVQRPDIVARLSTLPNTIKAVELYKIEQTLAHHVANSSQAKPTASTKAPAPVGNVGNNVTSASRQRSDAEEIAAYYKKKYGH